MLADKYKIEVSFPGSGLTETKTLNSKYEWIYEKEDGQIYFRKKLNTALAFRDDPALANGDFSRLYAIERSRNSRCDKVDVIISKRCDPQGAFAPHYQGYLSMIDGKWNKSHCEVEIPVRPLDQYACLYEHWEKPINILNIPILDKYDSRSTIGVIEYRECIRTVYTQKGDPPNIFNESCLGGTPNTNPIAWTLVYWQINVGSSVRTTWAREVFIGAKPGEDWTAEGDKWVRAPHINENLAAFMDHADLYSKTWTIVQYTLTNGLKLSNLLEEMIKTLPCMYTLVSNFFGVAPDGTAPANLAYSRAFDRVRRIYVYDKTDVTRAKDKDQSASGVGNEISIKKMFENLKALFNVVFMIDETTNVLRLEHISYFEDRRMLDLTQPQFLPDIEGRWKYTYAKEALPIREKFEFMEPGDPVFAGLPIIYNEACSNDGKNNETTTRSDYMITGVDDIVEHPDKYSDKGLVLIERHADGYIVSGLVLGNRVQRNGNLSWTSLHDSYYRWARPQSQGNMNGNVQNFFSFKRTRKQDTIQIHLCCADYATFNPLDLVRTQLGWGEIVSAKYTEPEEILTLELIHD